MINLTINQSLITRMIQSLIIGSSIMVQFQKPQENLMLQDQI